MVMLCGCGSQYAVLRDKKSLEKVIQWLVWVWFEARRIFKHQVAVEEGGFDDEGKYSLLVKYLVLLIFECGDFSFHWY